MRTERHTQTSKLIVAFCNFAEVPPNEVQFLFDSCAEGQIFEYLYRGY